MTRGNQILAWGNQIVVQGNQILARGNQILVWGNQILARGNEASEQRIEPARMLKTSSNDIYKPTLQVTLIFRRDLSDLEFLGYA